MLPLAALLAVGLAWAMEAESCRSFKMFECKKTTGCAFNRSAVPRCRKVGGGSEPAVAPSADAARAPPPAGGGQPTEAYLQPYAIYTGGGRAAGVPMPHGKCTGDVALQHMYALSDADSSRNAQLLRTFALAGLAGQVVILGAVMMRDLVDRPGHISSALASQARLMREGNFTAHRHIHPKEIAIALSHRNAHQMVLTNQWPCAIIFENDVALAPNFAVRLRAATLPDAFDWIKISTLVQHPDPALTLTSPVTVDAVPGGSRDAGGTASAPPPTHTHAPSSSPSLSLPAAIGPRRASLLRARVCSVWVRVGGWGRRGHGGGV